MKKGLKAIHIVLLALALLIFLLTLWIRQTFGRIRMAALLFTITNPMGGTDINIILSFLLNIILPVVILVVVLILIKHKKIKRAWIILILDSIIFIASLFTINKFLRVTEYLFQSREYTDIYENPEMYVDPKNITITGNDTNNLVLIYLESYEVSFADKENGGGSKTNYMPELTKLAFENQFFSNGDKLGGALEVTGTSWTIGAMTGATSGLPLNWRIRNSMSVLDKYMPGAYTLGDFLNDKGYIQEFVSAEDTSFAGMDKFYTQHGNHTIINATYMKDTYGYEESDLCGWGLKDEYLLEVSKDRLTQMYQKSQQENKPFNVTIETIDCHTPKGFTCKNCPNTYKSQYKNVIACQSKQIYDFIEWNKTQPWFSNTTFVIMGDHKTMAEKQIGFVDKNYERVTYNCFINSKITSTNNLNRKFTTLDMYPTILASMGFNIDGDKLALGTNLFSDKKTIVENTSLKYVNKELEKRSKHDTYIYGTNIY